VTWLFPQWGLEAAGVDVERQGVDRLGGRLRIGTSGGSLHHVQRELVNITFFDVSLLEASGGESMTKDTIRGSSDRSVLILTSLADWPKHGYALIKDIEGFAGCRLGPGTLYGALAKLERAGLVEALPAGDRRRPYRITAAGREFLNEQLTESVRIAEVGLRRIAAASS
jgi:DNA-binding PadR family transcriptional regulator